MVCRRGPDPRLHFVVHRPANPDPDGRPDPGNSRDQRFSAQPASRPCLRDFLFGARHPDRADGRPPQAHDDHCRGNCRVERDDFAVRLCAELHPVVFGADGRRRRRGGALARGLFDHQRLFPAAPAAARPESLHKCGLYRRRCRDSGGRGADCVDAAGRPAGRWATGAVAGDFYRGRAAWASDRVMGDNAA